MKYSFTLLLLFIIAVPASAQYITMINSFAKPEQHVRSGKPARIIDTYTSRLQGSKFISRKEISFDWSARRISYSRYDKKGVLTHQYETNLDSSLQKVLYLVNVNYEPKGIIRDSFWFTYDTAGTLTRMQCSFNGNYSSSDLKVNAEGQAAKAQVTNRQGEIIALEKAAYHPEDNYYVISRKANWNDERLVQDTQRIDQDKYCSIMDEKKLFNEQGDMTYQKLKGRNNRTGAEYVNEYEYDDKGNWLKKTAYIIDRKTGKRKLISRSEREITYQK
ncbi:hypothetical protein [Pseudobacter ginsenosidimutans]|uniref:YD repeat-containing protein n=1 Tax=Pseudobacter ginsenosidimutans TaxID=661488 RepID=A0A4Q7N5U6_9BACT|nr:hypothetical protein [Pseudobacter ginsenosidimutans]QEC44897.1 hypothetical protein FSB84_25650 [Pseudobacter ginsenosidimutans]RZS76390.1 hypothetical protein EV199_2274 [Pseudobacter ginsenosidimutans]